MYTLTKPEQIYEKETIFTFTETELERMLHFYGLHIALDFEKRGRKEEREGTTVTTIRTDYLMPAYTSRQIKWLKESKYESKP